MREECTKVYTVDLSGAGERESSALRALLHGLPSTLREELPRREEDALRTLCGRALVRHALKEWGVQNSPIVRGEHGKPVLKSGEAHFNLSHAKDMVVCAVSAFPVGVDVEPVLPRGFGRIANRAFFEEERARAQTLDGFYEIWTKKESALKYLGVGLGGLRRVNVGHGGVIFDGAPLPCRIETVKTGAPCPYFLSLCFETASFDMVPLPLSSLSLSLE